MPKIYVFTVNHCKIYSQYEFPEDFIHFILYVYFDCLFVCLFGGFRLTREFFTHLETPPLLVKGCKF